MDTTSDIGQVDNLLETVANFKKQVANFKKQVANFKKLSIESWPLSGIYDLHAKAVPFTLIKLLFVYCIFPE